MTQQHLSRSKCGMLPPRRTPMLVLTAVIASATVTIELAQAAEPSVVDLSRMSLEQLINIEITSVSRHKERLADAAATIYVISSDDIRRSGATTVPEVLRLAPNRQVPGPTTISTQFPRAVLTACSRTRCWCSLTAAPYIRHYSRGYSGKRRKSCSRMSSASR